MKYCIALLCLALATSHAAIVVPGANGTDGTLNIIANTEIDLSLAPTGQWDNDNTANAGKGVYDASKWAVVFKYTSVNIAAGATVTFKNHPSRAPVVWLVSGDVTISGTVKLDGENGAAPPKAIPSEPGPGGFRGGVPTISSGVQFAAGMGVGGGSRGMNKSAAYGTPGTGSPPAYGNASLIPLIGGSGGGGHASGGGGAGGGAILIASTSTVSVNGALSCKGGGGGLVDSGNGFYSGQGSGGGIRVVADVVAGSGQLMATAGQGSAAIPGNGRIRLERVINNSTASVSPAPSVVDLSANATALIWPPTDSPEVSIISLGGVNAPQDPRAGFGTIGGDVAIPTGATATAIIETRNVEQASQVKVRITPRDSAEYTEVNATYSSTVSTTPLVIRWTATLPTNLGYSAVQVRVVRP